MHPLPSFQIPFFVFLTHSQVDPERLVEYYKSDGRKNICHFFNSRDRSASQTAELIPYCHCIGMQPTVFIIVCMVREFFFFCNWEFKVGLRSRNVLLVFLSGDAHWSLLHRPTRWNLAFIKPSLLKLIFTKLKDSNANYNCQICKWTGWSGPFTCPIDWGVFSLLVQSHAVTVNHSTYTDISLNTTQIRWALYPYLTLRHFNFWFHPWQQQLPVTSYQLKQCFPQMMGKIIIIWIAVCDTSLHLHKIRGEFSLSVNGK
jgi:hypothetical protein